MGYNMDWKSILGQIAPTAATLLGGPFAGLAVAGIGKALGLDQPTTAKIQDALTQGQLSGDNILALKKAELDLQAHLADNSLKVSENGIELVRIDAADAASARTMQETVKSFVPPTLAIAVTGGFFSILVGLGTGYFNASNQALNIMLGSLGTAWISIIGFYFGSSAGSAEKTRLLAQSPAIGGK